MTRVLLEPPRGRPIPSTEPEALIEEARQRTRRRRAGYAVVALGVVALAVGLFASFGGGGRGGGGSASPHPSSGAPPAVRVVGTLRVPPSGNVLFAARGATLYETVFGTRSFAVVRVDPGGRTTTRSVRFGRAGFLADLSTGPDGVYAGTSVIKRFASVPDELLRIDPRTLAVLARASFASRAAAVERGNRMWVSLGDGRVARLDPRTLAVRASRRLLPARAAELEGLTLSKPAIGHGSVWVLAGDERDLELVRMDPASLAVRSRTRVPTAGRLAQELNGITADAAHVYLVGGAVVSVAASGRLRGRPVLVPDLQAAAIHNGGLVGLTYPPSLVLVTPNGRIEARKRMLDAGAQLVVSGNDAWFLGNAGEGNGIVHVRLR